MIWAQLVMSIIIWAVWITAVVWLGPKLGDRIAPWFERTGDPQAGNAAVWVASALVALLTGVVLMGAWAVF